MSVSHWPRRIMQALRALGFVVCLLYAFMGGDYSTKLLLSMRQEERAAAGKLAGIRASNEALRAVRDSLLSDTARIEKIARQRYGLIGDNEMIYRFVGGDARH